MPEKDNDSVILRIKLVQYCGIAQPFKHFSYMVLDKEVKKLSANEAC